MADRYLVATGNWNNTATWSASSGGAPGASFPVAGDNVFCDAASGAVTLTVNTTSACANFDCTGFTGTLAGSANLQIAGSLTLVAGMTFNFFGIPTFNATSAGKTITMAGKSWSSGPVFNGSGGGWTLQDAFSAPTLTITLTNGTLDTNGQTVTAGAISSAGGTLTLGASTLDLSSGTPIFFSGSSAVNAGTSQVNCTAGNCSFFGGGHTWNNVSFTNTTTANVHILSANNTFNNLTITASTVDQNILIFGDQTVTGTLTITGASASARKFLKSSTAGGVPTPGTAITITAAAVSLQDVDFADITGAGAASPFTGTRLGDCKGNSGITFTAAANKYYVGNTANWDGTVWALASGGAAGANNYPLAQDTCIFDANSFSANGQSVSLNNAPRIGSLDFSATDQTFSVGYTGAGATVFGDITLDVNITSFLSSATSLTFAGRTTQTLTRSSATLNDGFNPTIDSPGGTVVFADAWTFGSSRTLTLTRGTLNLNAQAVSVGIFSSNNSNTRAITSGGATLTLTGNNSTIWNTSTATGFTFNDSLQVDCTYSGATGTRTITGPTGFLKNAAPNIKISAGTDVVALQQQLSNVDFTGFAGTMNAAAVFSVAGSLTLVSGMTLSAGTLAVNFNATSGTKTITSAGKTIDRPVTFDGVGGTWQLADALTLGSTRTLTLTNGTFNMNNKAVSTGLFSSNNSNTRSITSGGATLTVTGTSGTIVTFSTNTNLTFNDALQIDCTGGGATARTITGGGTGAGMANCNIKVSAGTFTASLQQAWGNVDFTGFTGTWNTLVTSIYGSLTLGAGMTVASGTTALTMAATSGTKTITSNVVTMDRPVTFDGVGGTWQLADNMTVGATRTTTLTNGTLNLNTRTLSTGRFASSNSNARVLTFGAGGKIVTTDTTATTVFNCGTATNLTVNRTGGSIEIGGNTANTRTFAGGSQNWPDLTFTNTTPNGRLDITGSNTFKSLVVANPPQSVMFTAAETTTIEDENGFPSGSAGNLVTIGSITAANHNLAKTGSGRISSNYLSISRSQASPGSTWYAGTTSTDGGNNSGWNFTDPPSFPTGMMAAFRP